MFGIKAVAIGDGAVGKTSLLISYATGKFPQEYIPTVFDNYSTFVSLNNKNYNLGLWDTAGQEDFSGLRSLSYPESDIFLLCFSVVQPSSYYNVRKKWYSELRQYDVKTPIILIGCKTDLRGDQETLKRLIAEDSKPISYDQGYEMARAINAVEYYECSAKSQVGIHHLFNEVVKVSLKHRENSKKPPKKRPLLGHTRKKFYRFRLRNLIHRFFHR